MQSEHREQVRQGVGAAVQGGKANNSGLGLDGSEDGGDGGEGGEGGDGGDGSTASSRRDVRSSIVRPMMTALAAQKKAQMMWHWREHRHICENYSPYDPASTVAPGDGQVNSECTGWQFYVWGALNGMPALLEMQRQQQGEV